MRNLRLKLSVIVLINASLLGCGGGSGSSENGSGGAGTSASSASNAGASYSAISQANYETVAATVLDPMSELTNLNSATGLITSGVEVEAPALSLASASTRIYKRFSAKGAQLVTGATYTEACSRGGSVTVNESVADDNKVTAGDRLTIVANNCVEDNLPSLNGTLSLTVNSVTGDPVNTDHYSVGFTATYSSMALTSGTRRALIDGDLTIAASQNGSSAIGVGLSGSRLSLSVTQSGTATNAYTLADFNLSGTETGSTTTLAGNYTLSGTSAKLGAYAYRVQTVRPIVVSGSRASVSDGSVLITGSPATVTATALDGTTMRLEYSANGDGVITATSSLTRSQFDALN